VERTCATCAKGFDARSSRARYCSDKCRAKARYRRAVLGIEEKPATAKPSKPRTPRTDPPVEVDHGVTGAVIRELEAAGRADSSAGRAAIALARRDDDGAESSAGLAALTRELSARMLEALAEVESTGDSLDELRARREARRAAL